MDQLEIAQRQLDTILHKTPNRQGPLNRRAVLACLKHDICPAIAEFIGRPLFRQHASWSIQALSKGANTPERKLIEEIKHDLAQCAKTLLTLANYELVRKKLSEQNPLEEIPSKETMTISGNETVRTVTETTKFDYFAVLRSQVEALAKGEILELVNPYDYFNPVQQFHESAKGELVQDGGMVLAFNPELHPIGDFIVDCLLKRLEDYVKSLETLILKCSNAIEDINHSYEKTMTSFRELWERLLQHQLELQNLLKTGKKNRIRTSCTILTQLYAAYCPILEMESEFDWLGLPHSVIQQVPPQVAGRMRVLELDRKSKIWSTFWDSQTDKTTREMLDRVAVALTVLAQLNQELPPEITSFEKAVATGGLAMRTGKDRAVYWEKEKINGIHGVQFELLQELASKGRIGQPVTEKDLDPDRKKQSPNWLGGRKSRLCMRLPESLESHVKNIPKSQTGQAGLSYQLELDPNRIHLM